MPLLKVDRIPNHVAIIMDGNGRWAEQRGLLRPDGHHEGSQAVRRVVRAGRRLGVRALTLYAFSAQNWSRPESEVSSLMCLLREYLIGEREEILGNQIRLRAIGQLDRLPPFVREVLDELIESSAEHTGMVLTLALSYGGREEIAEAVRSLSFRVARGEVEPEAIDVDCVAAQLPSMEQGPVDLLIRTGNEQRVSNFLLWASAYAELYFSSALWPEWDATQLYQAIESFQSRERRFGKVPPSTSVSEAKTPFGSAPSRPFLPLQEGVTALD